MTEHYFSADPTSTGNRRDVKFDFMGDTLLAQVDAGVFSATRIDPGTRVLLKSLERHEVPGGKAATLNVLDIGCGWGPISLALAKKYPAGEILAVDVNRRALENTARNAALNEVLNISTREPGEVADDTAFDEIWSNPPIRIGKEALHSLLETWLARLTVGGLATFVVAKQLGAPSLEHWLNDLAGYRCQKVDQSKGYWILQVSREAK